MGKVQDLRVSENTGRVVAVHKQNSIFGKWFGLKHKLTLEPVSHPDRFPKMPEDAGRQRQLCILGRSC